MKATRILGLAAATTVILSSMGFSQGWQPLKNKAPFNADTMSLLQDGSILVHQYPTSNHSQLNQNWKLTPDNTGSYVNGTWTQVASLPSGYAPLYFSNQVLPDGRVIYAGGEYNFLSAVWTNLAAIYDPVANTWASLTAPSGWTSIGDAQSVVLPNGSYMQANALTSQQAILNASTLSWTTTGTGKADGNDEEGWTLLQNGLVLTVDCNNTADLTHSERFSPGQGKWVSAGSTIVKLADLTSSGGGSHEIGPAVVRPDGTVWATGAASSGTAHTAFYNSKTNTWTAGPDFPSTFDSADGPAALETSGSVLIALSPGVFVPGSHFYEYSDGAGLVQVTDPAGATNKSSYEYRLLVLPTGQIMEVDGTSSVQIYTPTGSPDPSWAPQVLQVSATSLTRGSSYRLQGTQLNGLSEAGAYGDDAQASTNYPLVRVTNNATGHAQYFRTHNPTSRSIAPGFKSQVRFDVPSTAETGASSLVVVANGIASNATSVTIN